MIVEFALTGLFLGMKFYFPTPPHYLGYQNIWGWILAISSLLLFIGLLFVFLLNFSIKGRFGELLENSTFSQGLVYFLAYFGLLRIGLISISLIYAIPLYPGPTPIFLLIFLLSFFPPILLYYLANSQSEKIYALSKETPWSIKLTGFWILLLTGAMQILSSDTTVIMIIGVILLISSYFYFNLNLMFIIVTPIVLIVHTAFSAFFSGAILSNLEHPDIVISDSKNITIVFTILFFIIPGILSLLLASTFFFKKNQAWIRSIHPPDEMAISLYDYNEEKEDEE